MNGTAPERRLASLWAVNRIGSSGAPEPSGSSAPQSPSDPRIVFEGLREPGDPQPFGLHQGTRAGHESNRPLPKGSDLLLIT